MALISLNLPIFDGRPDYKQMVRHFTQILLYSTITLTNTLIVHTFEVNLILDQTAKYNFVVKLEKLSSLELLIRVNRINTTILRLQLG